MKKPKKVKPQKPQKPQNLSRTEKLKQVSRIQSLEQAQAVTKRKSFSQSHTAKETPGSSQESLNQITRKDLKRAFILQELVFKKPLALRRER